MFDMTKIMRKILGFILAAAVITAVSVWAQVQSTTYSAHEYRAPTPGELQALVDIRSNVQDQIDTITGYGGTNNGGQTFSNVNLASGTNSGVVNQVPWSSSEITYFTLTNAVQKTNTTGRRAIVKVPFSQTAAAYNVLLIITNYSGPVGGASTITNVDIESLGSAATPTAGSNWITGQLFPNSVFVFSNTVGTVAILNTTNGQPTLYLQ